MKTTIHTITPDDVDAFVRHVPMSQVRRLARRIEGGGALPFYECRGFAVTIIGMKERFEKQYPALKKLKFGLLSHILATAFVTGLAMGSAAEQVRNSTNT